MKTHQLRLQGVKMSSPTQRSLQQFETHSKPKNRRRKKRGHLKVGLKSNVATSNLPVSHSNSMSEKRNLRRTQRFVWNIKKKLKDVSSKISVNLQHYFSQLSGSRSEADDAARTLPFCKSVNLQNLWPGKCDFIFISILQIREKFSIFFFSFFVFQEQQLLLLVCFIVVFASQTENADIKREPVRGVM